MKTRAMVIETARILLIAAACSLASVQASQPGAPVHARSLPGFLCKNHYILDLPCANVPSETKATWAPTSHLVTGRRVHTATLLLNGTVLIVGGWGTGSIVDGAELFNPLTETWSAAGHPTIPRADHTATLLMDGRVLVAGGDTGGAPPTFGRSGTAELYDPATGTWSFTGPMNTMRSGHTATLLQDGRVLVAGGYYTDNIATAELYDPRTGIWTETGSLNEARYWHTATRLDDGRVLVIRGSNDGDLASTLASTELYNPSSGRWSIAGNSNDGSVSHTATLMADGKVLVTGGNGGGIGGDYIVAHSDRFDPSIGGWRPAGDLLEARYGHAATLLPNGDVLISGGETQSSHYPTLQYTTLGSTERFEAATGRWTEAASLNSVRSFHTATLLNDGRVLVVGGEAVNSDYPDTTLNSAELFTPASVLSGLWGSPGESGWGAYLTQRGGVVFAVLYTYDSVGTPRWYASSACTMPSGSPSTGTCTGELYEVTGPVFFGTGFNPSLVNIARVGDIQLSFQNANVGSLVYDVNGQKRTVSVVRQVFASGIPSTGIDYSDLWWNPNESGWGLAITQQHGVMVLVWYIYEDSGAPVWYTATCTVTGTTCSGALLRTAGPAFGPTFDSNQVQVFTAGNLSVNFSDSNNATLRYTVNGVTATKNITRQLF